MESSFLSNIFVLNNCIEKKGQEKFNFLMVRILTRFWLSGKNKYYNGKILSM